MASPGITAKATATGADADPRRDDTRRDDPRWGTPQRLAELREERAALRPLLQGDWDTYDRHRQGGEAGCRELDFAPPHAAIRACVLKVMAACESVAGRRDLTAAELLTVLRAEGIVGAGGVYTHRYGAVKEPFTFARLPLWYVVGIVTGDGMPGDVPGGGRVGG